jgi:hypothetical protein
MVKIQLELNENENNILEILKLYYKTKTKTDALKKLLISQKDKIEIVIK